MMKNEHFNDNKIPNAKTIETSTKQRSANLRVVNSVDTVMVGNTTRGVS
jgi:hypothetical protein